MSAGDLHGPVAVLRAHRRTGAARIVLMSARALGEALLAGTPHEGTVAKPFDIAELAATVARCLGADVAG